MVDNASNYSEKETDLRAIYNLIAQVREDVRKGNELTAIYKTELESAKDRITKLESLQQITENTLRSVRQSVTVVNNISHKNNIILHNLAESPNENMELLVKEVHKLFTEVMHISISLTEIDSVRRLGVKKQDKTRPLMIKFVCLWRKFEILRANKTLRNHNLSVTEDFSPNVRSIRKNLIPFLTEARKNNLRAYLRGDRLLIDGTLYTLEELQAASTAKLSREECSDDTKVKEKEKRKLKEVELESRQLEKKQAYAARLEQFSYRLRSHSIEDPTRTTSSKQLP